MIFMPSAVPQQVRFVPIYFKVPGYEKNMPADIPSGIPSLPVTINPVPIVPAVSAISAETENTTKNTETTKAPGERFTPYYY